MSATAIEFSAASKCYGDKSVVDGLSFAVRAGKLSGGMRRPPTLARALINDPAVLIMATYCAGA